MSVYKRGGVYWYEFVFDGHRIRQSSKVTSARKAREIEAAHRVALAQGRAGISRRQAVPTLREFAPRFMAHVEVRSAAKPRTVEYYRDRLEKILRYRAVAEAKLTAINEALIEGFVQHRRPAGLATTNRCLSVLRRALRVAHEWDLIDRVPRIRLLGGEKAREYVISPEDELVYLNFADQPLRDIGILMIDTGLRIGEAAALRWEDVFLDDGAKGYILVREGKTKNARRAVPLSDRARHMLAGRSRAQTHVFGPPMRVTSLGHAHARIRGKLKLPNEFVLHSFRHTFCTRLGEAGVDAFTIMRLAGHSSITISQRYVHPSQEAAERAVERLEALNRDRVPTKFPTEGREPKKKSRKSFKINTGA